MHNNTAKLIKIGKAAFGDSWQSQIARVLDVDPRRIQQWVREDRIVPDSVFADPDLIKMIDQKLESLTECKIMLNTFNAWIVKKHDTYKSVHGNVHKDVFIHLDPIDYYDDSGNYQIPDGWRFVKNPDDLSYLVTQSGEMVEATDLQYSTQKDSIYCNTKQGRVFFDKA